MPRASNPPTRGSLASNGRTRIAAEAKYPGSHSGAAEQNLHQDPRNNAPSTTLNTASPGEKVLPPRQTKPAPLLERTESYRSHDSKPFPLTDNNNNSSLPSISKVVNFTQVDQWPLRQLASLPSVYGYWRVKWWPKDGQPLYSVQRPIQPPGPPLKPLDGKQAEEIAQEQWRISKLEEERREAEEACRAGDRSRRFR